MRAVVLDDCGDRKYIPTRARSALARARSARLLQLIEAFPKGTVFSAAGAAAELGIPRRPGSDPEEGVAGYTPAGQVKLYRILAHGIRARVIRKFRARDSAALARYRRRSGDPSAVVFYEMV
jgi:hypothetical protein